MGKNIVRKKLVALLSEKGITAYKLAKSLGRDKTLVYKWIYGIGSPNAKTMLKLMLILDISAQEILEIFAEEEKEVKTDNDD